MTHAEWLSKALAASGMSKSDLARRIAKLLPHSNIKLCVVGLADDRVMVKRLKRGSEPGRFTLQSVNAPDIENVEVVWASRVTWVRFPD